MHTIQFHWCQHYSWRKVRVERYHTCRSSNKKARQKKSVICGRFNLTVSISRAISSALKALRTHFQSRTSNWWKMSRSRMSNLPLSIRICSALKSGVENSIAISTKDMAHDFIHFPASKLSMTVEWRQILPQTYKYFAALHDTKSRRQGTDSIKCNWESNGSGSHSVCNSAYWTVW